MKVHSRHGTEMFVADLSPWTTLQPKAARSVLLEQVKDENGTSCRSHSISL